MSCQGLTSCFPCFLYLIDDLMTWCSSPALTPPTHTHTHTSWSQSNPKCLVCLRFMFGFLGSPVSPEPFFGKCTYPGLLELLLFLSAGLDLRNQKAEQWNWTCSINIIGLSKLLINVTIVNIVIENMPTLPTVLRSWWERMLWPRTLFYP